VHIGLEVHLDRAIGLDLMDKGKSFEVDQGMEKEEIEFRCDGCDRRDEEGMASLTLL
jgi:hypothetical protein